MPTDYDYPHASYAIGAERWVCQWWETPKPDVDGEDYPDAAPCHWHDYPTQAKADAAARMFLRHHLTRMFWQSVRVSHERFSACDGVAGFGEWEELETYDVERTPAGS